MTVTLHDVSNLLHLPIRGSYPPDETVSVDRAIELAMENFGVTYADALPNIVQGPYYLYSWLQDLLRHHMEEGGDEDIALRIYLLQLLSYSIFTNKGSNRAEAKLLLWLGDLRRVGQWAWGVGALVNLYHELNFSSLHTTASLSGFPALLQAWIMWYFPGVWKRKVAVAGSTALGGHWSKMKTNQTLVECRRRIDQLTTDDVCWTPFQGQQNGRPLEDFSLFRGWLKWANMSVRYMPDRCLRQFGYRQSIPHPPLRPPRPSHIEIMRSMVDFLPVVAELVAGARVARYPCEVVEGYLNWYIVHSCPRLMGDLEEDAPEQQQEQQPAQQDEPAPSEGADVPQHHPQWVHQLVHRVREALREGGVRREHYQGLYDLVGFPQYPPPPDRAGPGRHRRRHQ